MMTYKRPNTIRKLHTNHKHLALSKTREHVKGMSGPCGHCALCGNHGKHNKSMVPCVPQRQKWNLSTQPKIDMRKPWYSCSDLCYLPRTIFRQTKNKFSTRWSSHHSNWNRPNCDIDENNKDVALLRYFPEFHGNVNKPPIHEAYIVTFSAEPKSLSLVFCEDKWYRKLNAQINVQNMILPRVR